MKKILTLCLMMMMWTSIALAAVNINSANVNTLETIHGIGPAKAAAIVEDRNVNGQYKTKQDLMRVKGIGSRLLEKIMDEIEI